MPTITETTDAAAGTSTTYSLTTGQTAQGTLGSAGDHDWYAVTLVGGQTYSFAMTGTGLNNVQDTYLRLYAPGGSTLVAQDDNGLQGANSVFTYTAAASGTYYIDAAALNNAGSGQYGIAFTAGSRPSFDLQMGAGVIDTDLSWSATAGTGANVTYGFRQTSNGEQASFFQTTAAQMAAVQSILQMYSEVCGLTFSQVNPGGYTNNATILISSYNANDGAGAYAYYPGSTSASAVAGDLWLNSSVSTTSIQVGSYSYFAIAHELGHAVGLSHPGKYNAAAGVSITYSANAQFTQDTHQYSVMSYFDESNTTGSYNSYPDTLMLFDIYAVQQIYGANNSTRATDTTYGFNSNAGSVYDFTINTDPAMCIWDGGGTDTLDCSGYSQNQTINLNGGAFSNIGGMTGNLSIALGVVIENVFGGAGGDHIYLTTGATNNAVNGGGGTDYAHVTYSYGSGYTVSGTTSNFSMSGSAGTDTFQSIEYVMFSDGTQVTAADLLATQPSGTGQISISDVTILEGDGGTKVATFNVTRAGGTAAFAVNFATANGTATAGSDYVATSGTLNFGNGVNSQTVSVTINGDTSFEQNETFFVNLSAATNGATIIDSQGQGTITDDDTTPVAGAISISDLTITEGNTGTQVATFTVARTGGTAAFSVNYATANGTATAGSDYVATSGTLNFAAGVNTQTVSVTINGDVTIEANETFFVNLSSASNGAAIADSQGQGTIINNDGVSGSSSDDYADSLTDATAPIGQVAVNGSSNGNLESVGDRDFFQFQVTAGATYLINLQGQQAGGGTLEDPYLRIHNSSGAVVAANDDIVLGIHRDSGLTFQATTTGTYYIEAAAFDDNYTGTYSVSISSVGAPEPGSVSINDVSITEGNFGTKFATFTVTRSGGTAAFDVNFTTSNGSATAADQDYGAKAGTLHFDAGVNTQTISVIIGGDTKIEANETFFVNLSGATNGAIISDSQGIGTIVDDDGNHLRDFNADTQSDLLWHNDAGSVSTWDMHDRGFGAAVIANVSNDWRIAGTGDFNGDRMSDIVWRNDSGAVATWDMHDRGFGAAVIANVSNDWHIAGTGDFNGDGNSDIVWRNDSGAVATWDMNDRSFGSVVIANVSNDWHIAGTGDFNGDGNSDILWRNDSGAVATWDMNDRSFGAAVIANVSNDWHIAGTGDFNGDGTSDIAWRNDGGAVATWNMHDRDYNSAIIANVPNDWHIV